jgi:hypothetical protein
MMGKCEFCFQREEIGIFFFKEEKSNYHSLIKVVSYVNDHILRSVQVQFRNYSIPDSSIRLGETDIPTGEHV